MASDRSSSGWLWSSGAGSGLLLSTSEDGRRLTVLLRRRPALNCPCCGRLGLHPGSACLCCGSVLSSDSSSTEFPFCALYYTFWHFHRPGFFSVVLVAPAAGNFPRSPISSSVVSILGPPSIESQPCERYIGDSPPGSFHLVAFPMPLVVNLILRRGEYVERTRYWPPFSDLVSCRRVGDSLLVRFVWSLFLCLLL